MTAQTLFRPEFLERTKRMSGLKADAAFACSLIEFEYVVRTGETLDRSESVGRGRADGDIRFRVPNQAVRFQPIHGRLTLREQKPS